MASSRQNSNQNNVDGNGNGARNVCYDPLELERFIDYDQLRYPSPSLSSTSPNAQFTARPGSATANPNNTLLSAQHPSAEAQMFSAPSHQYDLHKQQTPLPLGAVANTLAVTEQDPSSADWSALGFGNENFLGMSPTSEYFDMPASSNTQPSFSAASGNETEIDTSDPTTALPSFFFQDGTISNASDFISPTAIGEQEDQMMSRDAAENPAVAPRIWVGMHQQQAAMARARHQHPGQNEHPQQPQSMQLHHQPSEDSLGASSSSTPQGQFPLPSLASQMTMPAPSFQPTDAMVEDKITRLLNSMRQSSEQAGEEEAGGSGSNSNMPNIARMKKDDDDMDEDERLLASEEGKKLSSKERRQLRNKVSARAFRSRRKEYIGQLEAELATKANETNELRNRNRSLMHENTRLTDLTRMLLSSPQFSSVLDSMSAQTSSEQQGTSSTDLAAGKDVTGTYPSGNHGGQGGHGSSHHIGMTIVPDQPIDLSQLNLRGNTSWLTGNPTTNTNIGAAWNTQQPQVFSLVKLPEGPAVDQLDVGSLSGKSSSPCSGISSFSSEKKHGSSLPEIEAMPSLSERQPTSAGKEEKAKPLPIPEDISYDEADPAFNLFEESPPNSSPVEVDTCGTEMNVDDATSADVEWLTRLISSTESVLERLAHFTAHL